MQVHDVEKYLRGAPRNLANTTKRFSKARVRREGNRRLSRERCHPAHLAFGRGNLGRRKMSEILTERSGSILRITFNRPAKKNAMTSSMYTTMAQILNDAAKDEDILVVLWDGAGDSFSAGNDLADFLKNPPGPGESPQAQLANALLNFDKPLVAAVKGVAIGGGTTLLTHCDFVFAGES